METITSTYDKVRIHEALELLDAVAAEGHADLKDMVGDGYESIKEYAGTLKSNVQREVNGAYKAGTSKVRSAASVANNHAHANPWAYIGGSAAVGLVVGFLVASGRK